MGRTRSLYPDTIFAESYHVVHALAVGRGEVYRAKDTVLDRPVALKLFRHATADPDKSWVASLGREGRLTALVRQHKLREAIVDVYHFGTHEGIGFVAFEWLDGGDAETWANKIRPTLERPWEQATQIAINICRGLIAAHDSGILHLDVKPANLLLTLNGAAKLADFGVSVEVGPNGRCTNPHPGTKGYSSPEQAGQIYADQRSDVFALGATYFHLLTGSPPSQPGQDPRTLDPSIPHPCSVVVRKATAPHPDDRYESARSMFEALVSAAAEIRDDILSRYLDWVLVMNSSLRLPVLNAAVDLDRVYTALKVDPTTDRERQLTWQLIAAEMSGDSRDDTVAGRVAAVPFTLTIEARDRPSVGSGGVSITLAEAYCENSVLVILGDPGSGKTTLARWLARAAARGWNAADGKFAVETRQIDPNKPDDKSLIVLGPRRLPILVRAADYARDRQYRRQKGESPLPLFEYLGRPAIDRVDDGPTDGDGRPFSGDRVNEVLRRAIRNRTALLIIDGLDEVPDDEERKIVRGAVQAFIREHVAPDPTGNKIIVTSRIAGYQVAPLEGDLVGQVTVERMERGAIEHFVRAWLNGCGAAEEQADALLKQIDPKVRPELWDMSANPLLCGVLTAVFHKRGGTLPATRVELYRQAVDEFLKVWEDRTLSAGRTPMGKEEVVRLLERVATVYHQDRPTGMLSGDELRTLLVRLRCDDLNIAETLDPPATVVDSVNALMAVLREPVGLLVPRYEGVYGFIHLTFQEYLAACHLTRAVNVEGVFANIRQRLDTARWREPVLMALGEFGRKNPERLLELAGLVLNEDGQYGELLPRGLLTVVSAMPDMLYRPSELVEVLVNRLLVVYADPDSGPSRFERLRELVEAAVGGDEERRRSMRQLEPVATERALIVALSHPLSAAAAAALVRRLEWFTRPVGEALLAARAWDSADWDWPVHAALREMATCPPPPKKPAIPQEVTALNNLRATYEKNANVEQKTAIEAQIVAHERQHSVTLERHRLVEEKFRAELDRYETAGRFVPRVDLPTTDLPFRRAVEDDRALRNRIVSDLDWLRVVLVLYGGVGDFRTSERMKEYRQFENFINLGDSLRKVFLATHQEQWGKEDTVYRIALYLDTRAGVWVTSWDRPPEFNARFITDDSPLTPLLLPALKSGRSIRELTSDLIKLAAGGTPDEQADAVAAVAALAAGITPGFQAIVARPHVQARLHRAGAALRDPVLRTASQVVPGLRSLVLAGLPGEWDQWSVLADAAIGMIAPGSPVAIDTHMLCGGKSARPEPLAELLATRFLGVGQDDPVYQAAVLLDTFTAKTTRPETLARAIALVPLSRHRRSCVRTYTWEVEQVPPRRIDSNDLPGFVMTAIENIHPELSMTRGWAVGDIYLSIGRENPNLVPELLAVAARDTGNRSDRDYAIKPLAPELVDHPDLAREVRKRAEALIDPYHRSRAMLRLLPLFPGDSPTIRSAALSDIRAIEDPFRRSQVYERLLAVTPHVYQRASRWWQWRHWAADCEDRQGLLAEARRTVRAIADPDDRARALARLSAFYPGSERAGLLAEAVRTARRIPEPYAKAETLRLLLPQLVAFPGLAEKLVHAIDEIPDMIARSSARDWLVVPLIDATPHIQKVLPDGVTSWSVLGAAAAIRDMTPDAPAYRDPMWLWTALRNSEAEGIATALYSLGQDEGLTVTRAAAEVLDQLTPGEVNILEPLVPLLQSPEPEALPVVAGWFSRAPGPLRRQAAILLAERYGLTLEVLPEILESLRSTDDLTRIRAAQVVHHPLVCPETPARRLSVIGHAVIERLIREGMSVANTEPNFSIRIAWIGLDLLIDDASAVAKWLDSVRTDPMVDRPVGGRLDPAGDPLRRGRVAEGALNLIEAVTPPVWEILVAALRDGPVPVRTAVLIVLMRLAHQSSRESGIRLTPQRWAQAAGILSGIGRSMLPDTEVMLGGPNGLIRAAADATGLPGDLVEYSRRIHRDKYVVRLHDLLSRLPPLPPDVEHLKPLPGFGPDTPAITLLDWLRHLASRHLYASSDPDKYLAPSDAMTRLLRERPKTLELLCDWLAAELTDAPTPVTRFRTMTDDLLIATAHAAAVDPTAFEYYGGNEQFRGLLASAARRAATRLGRAAAIVMLGRLRHFNREVAEAFEAAALGVTDLRQAAQTAAGMFRHDNPEFLPTLTGRPESGTGLYHPSGVVAYQTGLILEAVGRHARGSAGDRTRTGVLHALANAIRHPSTNRAVHFGHTLSRLPDAPRLNQLLLRILLRTAGVE